MGSDNFVRYSSLFIFSVVVGIATAGPESLNSAFSDQGTYPAPNHELSLDKRVASSDAPAQQNVALAPPVPILDLSSQYIVNALAASGKSPKRIGPTPLATTPTGAGLCSSGSPCADGR
ncbi:MAG: hypothetical protein Q9218_004049 [Villophora microphyllina]